MSKEIRKHIEWLYVHMAWCAISAAAITFILFDNFTGKANQRVFGYPIIW